MIAIAVLLLLTVGWVALALAPAIAELAHPKDDLPLNVDMYEGDVRSFAIGFRRYMTEQLPNLQLSRRLRGGQEGILPDGTTLLKLVDGASPLLMHAEGLDEAEIGDRVTHKLVVSYAKMVLPGGLASVGGLYATDLVCGGEAGVFRALLGERDVVLGRRSVVLRWIHSDANLTVEEGATLHGRASAERRFLLAENTRFERIYGRPLLFGEPFIPPLDPPGRRESLIPFELPNVLDATPSRVIVSRSLAIPAGSVVTGNLVVRGDLRIGAHSRVIGSVKSHGRLTVEPYSHIAGGAVSTDSIDVQRGAILGGPVVAEHDVILRTGALVGQYSKPATVTADRVTVSIGAAVFGTIWTRKGGTVQAADAD
jgi:cytoskeletal protein CcmA (bactofilin family)